MAGVGDAPKAGVGTIAGVTEFTGDGPGKLGPAKGVDWGDGLGATDGLCCEAAGLVAEGR
jgi:hypothetical protein